MRRFREEHGQVMAFTVIALVSMLGMAALVVDVGSWFRADRKMQAIADASALAGVQELPYDPGAAVSRALEYSGKNDGAVGSSEVAVSSAVTANDSISVTAKDSAPGFFSKVFSIASVDVAATATARVSQIGRAKWVVPIVIHEAHPLLQCTGSPCFNTSGSFPLVNLHDPGSPDGAGAFGLANLTGEDGDNVGASTLASWMLSGYNGYLGPGFYQSVPGAKFNSSNFQEALSLRLGTECLIPIYRSIVGSGSNAQYEVVSWVGFIPEGWSGGGSNATLHGRFVPITWEGESTTNPSIPYYGARTIALVS